MIKKEDSLKEGRQIKMMKTDLIEMADLKKGRQVK